MWGNYYILTYNLIYIGVSNGLSQYVTDETRLHQDIFQKRPYIKDVRPVANQSDVVTVKFGLSLQSIDSLDPETELLHTNCWLNMCCKNKYLKEEIIDLAIGTEFSGYVSLTGYISREEEWKDHQFAWKQSDYGGVSSIRVNIDDIWVPDISPYNAQRFDFDILKDKTAVVYSSGKVSWVLPILLSTSCTVDLWKYPYDKQTCMIKFGSWTYDGSKVNLTSRSDQVDVSTYSPSKSYKLLKYTSKRNAMHYDCCPETYIDIEIVLQLKRRSTYTTHLYISPAVIIALLIPVIFILPPECNEKLTFGIGLLVTDAIVFMAMIDGLPIMGHMTIPLIGVYHIINLVLISISLVISAIVMNIWNKGERAKLLPTWINTVILVPLGKVLCISKEDIIHQETGIDIQRLKENESDDVPMDGGQNGNLALWRQLAIIIDRLFFLIFLAVVIVCVIAFGSM